MDKSWILVLTLSTWIFHSVDSYRNDVIQSTARQGCIWSSLLESLPATPSGMNNGSSSALTSLARRPVIAASTPGPGFLLDCNLRTLNVDFWNYTFNKDQVEQTSQVKIRCNDKLFFDSFLTSNQSLFRLVNLKQVEIDSCKIRKMPGRVWGSLGFLKSLVLRSQNGEWSSAVGLDIEAGSFEGLGQLESLDLSQNNIWSLPNKNIFCPLKNLLKLNLSRNRLSDIEELGTDSTTTGGSSSGDNNGYCGFSVQNLDLSFNTLRRVGNNAFSRLWKLIELRLQNNLLEELEDSGFGGLSQLKVVNLSSNRLVALPPSIFRLNPALREINLSNNSISALSPQVFSGLESLLSLDLSRNTLTSQWIKENMFHRLMRLVILRLSFNQLSYVDANIFKDLKSLQVLSLDNNRIETINPLAFSSLSNLHVLDLSSNRLAFIDSRLFASFSLLRQLYLDHNKIRKMDDDSLKNCTNLQDLGLADNLLQEVPVALRAGLSHLVTLDVGENRIGTVNNESFSGLGQLYGLRIVDNRLTELPRGFCDPLKLLRVLNVAQNRINKISSTAFTSCSELRALRLDTNSMEELPTNLAPQLPSLLWLNVSENHLRWADYHLLPQTIEWLDLSYNNLETLGGPTSSSERSQSSTPYHLRVLDASHNQLTTLDYTTIPPTLETLRVNHNRLKNVASDTFIRSSRLRRVELMGNQLENLPLASLRFPPVPIGKPLPEFYLGGNPFLCDCTMEWLTRVNQLTVLRTHPRIVDLDAIVCRPTFSRPNQVVPLVETRPKDFLCPYKSHCFALCHCCDFDACDCEMTCPGNCTCYHDTAWSANIVECSNLQYSDVPKRIPMDATEIYLDGNNMPELESHIFIGKKNLRVLFLNDSRIEFIRNKTFNGLKSLEVLRLEENLLTELHGFEFADLENVRELYLQNNLLRFISKETFVELKFLQVLRLDGNLLIDFNVWELSGNGYLNSVMLAGNPWSCECEFLIPFRTWVASKTAIVVDFTVANCQAQNSTHVLASGGSSSDHHNPDSLDTRIIPNPNNGENAGSVKIQPASPKLYPIQVQHPIMSMCNHNKEINFNFNPIRAIETEIMNNHISAMGGAEKVAVFHPSSEDEIQFSPVDSDAEANTLWTLVLTLTALIVLALVIVVIFRKEIYYWIYTRVFANNLGSHFPSFLLCCCGEKVAGKKSSTRSGGYGDGGGDDSDKLFDAYFIYSKKDEDILVQKIAPELESQGPPNFRLCLHYRDLCLNLDNPWNTDMILSACDASKRVVLVLSRTFLQSELSHGHFRQAIQSAISRHQKKLILILLPPFTEQNLSTIYPELKNSTVVKSSALEWTDKNFWSKLKLILPTPSIIPSSGTLHHHPHTSTGSRGSSLLISSGAPPLIDLHSGASSNGSTTMSSYTINRLDYPYSSHHQYHRNIMPYQIPMSNCSTLTAPVQKHHIALTAPFFHPQQQQQQCNQQNHYNSSQHSSQLYYGGSSLQSFIPVATAGSGGHGPSAVYPMSTLPSSMTPAQHFSFNESFRRHLQQNQKNLQQHHTLGHPPHHPHHSQFVRDPRLQHHQQQQQPCNNNNGTTSYQPLEPNYSSSAISSSAEELEHVYSTLDSPMVSSHSVNTNMTNLNNSSGSGGNSSSGCGANDKSQETILCNNQESANKPCIPLPRVNTSSNSNSSSNKRNSCRNEFSSQNQSFSRGTSNSSSNNNNNNNDPGGSDRSELPPSSGQCEGHPVNNNGQMYFV